MALTNCTRCGHPLRIQDLKSRKYTNNSEQFVFTCSLCKHESKMVSEVFDNEGHVGKKYITMLKDDKDCLNYMPKRLFNKIVGHFQDCSTCSQRLNEEYLNEVEDKMKFDERCYKYFKKNSESINKEVKITTEDKNTFYFRYQGRRFKVKRDDAFFQDSERVCYYLKSRIYLVGMVSFVTFGKNIMLEQLWIRPKEQIDNEKRMFKKIKQQKNRLYLSTVQKIFETLNK